MFSALEMRKANYTFVENTQLEIINTNIKFILDQ